MITPGEKPRSAISHGRRAESLNFIIPPDSACPANEDNQALYRLFDSLTDNKTIAELRREYQVCHRAQPVFPFYAPITPDVADLYAYIFHPGTLELVSYEDSPNLKAA